MFIRVVFQLFIELNITDISDLYMADLLFTCRLTTVDCFAFLGCAPLSSWSPCIYCICECMVYECECVLVYIIIYLTHAHTVVAGDQ